MDDEERQHYKKLLETHKRRLRPLELTAAEYGINTPAEIRTQIDLLKETIKQIEAQLREKPPTEIERVVGGATFEGDRLPGALELFEALPIDTIPLLTSSSLPTIYHGLLYPNRLFVGREAKLKELAAAIKNSELG